MPEVALADLHLGATMVPDDTPNLRAKEGTSRVS